MRAMIIGNEGGSWRHQVRTEARAFAAIPPSDFACRPVRGKPERTGRLPGCLQIAGPASSPFRSPRRRLRRAADTTGRVSARFGLAAQAPFRVRPRHRCDSVRRLPAAVAFQVVQRRQRGGRDIPHGRLDGYPPEGSGASRGRAAFSRGRRAGPASPGGDVARACGPPAAGLFRRRSARRNRTPARPPRAASPSGHGRWRASPG